MTITANGHANGHANGLKNHSKPSSEPDFGFSTRAIHIGSEPDPITGAVIPPISLSTTYKQDAVGVHKVCQVLPAYRTIRDHVNRASNIPVRAIQIALH